jgi:hypothetical protein
LRNVHVHRSHLLASERSLRFSFPAVDIRRGYRDNLSSSNNAYNAKGEREVNNLDKITLAGTVFALIAAAFLIALIMRNPFPMSGLTAQSDRFVNATSNIGSQDSKFMWTNLSKDLAGQAFVIFAAAAGCLAVLRTAGTKEPQ